MSKEIVEIPLAEFAEEEYCYGASSDTFKWIRDKIVYADLEKGYEDREIVLERIEDGKRFRFEVSLSPHVSMNDDASGNRDPLIGTEILTRQKGPNSMTFEDSSFGIKVIVEAGEIAEDALARIGEYFDDYGTDNLKLKK